ncbi:aminotransferase class V-fold PLP-dependent enzyme [Aliikangiella marina]|uniref:Aminotransferase class V-fold PLP-dependent enzyme n=1 Tax=Aliikangiella marina TaxID=1712262 RepID=A0A545TDG3_9GAMM|nr:cysteine desulfurase [Aliikangiella marina]TQV75263.1 aminotransferase class V-fold PLP-dependent enzyme [Aliikangiella marina]
MSESPWRKDFPALSNKQLSYLDSASSCQTPQIVINAIHDYLTNGHGNPHRGMYSFSENAEKLVSQCRAAVANLVNASPEQVALTKSTTESLNLVAHGLKNNIKDDQTIVVTQTEHHANLLPWQRLSHLTGAKLIMIPIDERGEISQSWLNESTFKHCAVLACSHVSNLTGVTNPIERMIKLAKSQGAITVVDGAQSIAHQQIDFSAIDCDYFAFSGHKIYGPPGIGCLITKHPEYIEPLTLGGGIVNRVTNHEYYLTDRIERLEAGSINMLGVAGLVASLDYFAAIDREQLQNHEHGLLQQARKIIDAENFKEISHPHSGNILTIASDTFHSHDVASVCAENNVAVRAGHHCAQPFLNALGFKHCVRISFGIYNDESDIIRLQKALSQVAQFLA